MQIVSLKYKMPWTHEIQTLQSYRHRQPQWKRNVRLVGSSSMEGAVCQWLSGV